MPLTTERAEKYRTQFAGYPRTKRGDPYGFFIIPTSVTSTAPPLRCLASSPADGISDFDHVSVSFPHRTPTWDEMCKVKDLFFDPEDCVVQYHPAAAEYVNMHKFCLHLWRWSKGEFPKPNKWEIGL